MNLIFSPSNQANQLNFTLWNYNPTNDNIYGDHWNGEDFSIYSPKPSPSHSRTTSLNSSFAIAPGSQSSSPSSKSKQAAEAEAVAAAAAAALAKSKRPPPKVLKETNVNDLDIKFTDSPRTVTAGGGATPTTPTTPFEITNAYFDMEGDRAHHQNDGGRALDAIMRTYAAKTAGEPVSMKFDLNRLSFKLEFLSTPEPHPQQDNNNSDSSTPNRLSPRKKVTLGKDPRSYITEIFIPNYHYGSLDGVKIEVSDGEWMYDREKQTLYWKYDAAYRPAGMGGSLYNLLGSSSASSSNAVANSKSSGYAKGGRILHTITITVPESQMRNRPASGIVSSLTTGGIMVAMGAVAVAVMFKFFQQ